MTNIEFLDADWLEVFTALQEPPQITLMDAPTLGLENHSIGVLTLYNISLHWAIKKKWKKNHKIPYPRKLVKVMEPFGRLLARYIELCIQCHSFLKPRIYLTSAEWFWHICRESQRNTIFKSDNIGKSESLANRREIINSIADGINPISQNLAIHEWRLIECALSFPRGDIFNRDYVHPYIKDYRAWINAAKGPEWGTKLIENDKLFVRHGQGKGKILLDFKTFLNQPKLLK